MGAEYMKKYKELPPLCFANIAGQRVGALISDNHRPAMPDGGGLHDD